MVGGEWWRVEGGVVVGVDSSLRCVVGCSQRLDNRSTREEVHLPEGVRFWATVNQSLSLIYLPTYNGSTHSLTYISLPDLPPYLLW